MFTFVLHHQKTWLAAMTWNGTCRPKSVAQFQVCCSGSRLEATLVLECLLGRATTINRYGYFSIHVYGQGANNFIIISYQGAPFRRTKLTSCALGYIMWCVSKDVLASFYILRINWLVSCWSHTEISRVVELHTTGTEMNTTGMKILFKKSSNCVIVSAEAYYITSFILTSFSVFVSNPYENI